MELELKAGDLIGIKALDGWWGVLSGVRALLTVDGKRLGLGGKGWKAKVAGGSGALMDVGGTE